MDNNKIDPRAFQAETVYEQQMAGVVGAGPSMANEAARVAQGDRPTRWKISQLASGFMHGASYRAFMEEIDALLAQAAPPAAPVQGDARRAEFEVWALDQGFPLQLTQTEKSYLDPRTASAWDGWQAAPVAPAKCDGTVGKCPNECSEPCSPATGESGAEPIPDEVRDAWMKAGMPRSVTAFYAGWYSAKAATPPAAKSEAASQPGEMGAGVPESTNQGEQKCQSKLNVMLLRSVAPVTQDNTSLGDVSRSTSIGAANSMVGSAIRTGDGEAQNYRTADGMPTERAVLEREWRKMRDQLAALPAASAQQDECMRSHPHENMNAACAAKTIEARAMNQAAQQDEREAGEISEADARGCIDTYEVQVSRLRRALRPFADLATPPLSWAMVEHCVKDDPEKQTLQRPQMQRAFNRAAQVYAETATAAVAQQVQADVQQDEREARAFEDWLARVCPSGDCEAVQRQWEESSDYADLHDDQQVQAGGEDKRDAERYRWMKAKPRSEMYRMGVDLDWYEATKNLDAAIDAAMSRQQPQPSNAAACTNSDVWNCKYCDKTTTCEALAAQSGTTSTAVLGDLSPCPFCGGMASSPEVEQIEHAGWVGRIACDHCDAVVSLQYSSTSPGIAGNAVIAAWNCRASEQPQGGDRG